MTRELRVGGMAFVMAVAAACGDEPGPVSEGSRDASQARTDCERPYSDTSPWNVPVPESAEYATASDEHVRAIGGPLTSDPTQYTYPVYAVDAATPRENVEIRGWFSNVTDGGRRLQHQRGRFFELPIPEGAEAASGTDAQVILVDRETGDEWGVWRLERRGDGWSAENGYRYNVRWSGVPPRSESGRPFLSRGAGVPYLAGLVRRCEIDRGRIDHALAFAYDFPSADHVFPATKSDGHGSGPEALPEGARLQLDPTLEANDIRAWGCHDVCFTIARALQEYGMYVVDNSGRPKIMLEYESTARWEGRVTAETATPIPMTSFRVLAFDGGAG